MNTTLKYALLCLVMLFALRENGYAQKIELMVKAGHEKDIVHTSMSADETKLFTVDRDNFGILWEVATGRQLRSFDHVSNGVFTNNDQALLMAYTNSTFSIIDLLGNVIKTFPGQATGNYVINNPSVIYPDQGLMIYSNKFVNINTGNVVKPQCSQYSSTAFAPSAGIVAVGGDDGNVAICDVKDGKLLKTIGIGFGAGGQMIEFLNFAKDDNLFLAGCGESKNIIKIIDYAANAIKQEVQYPSDLRYVTAAVLAPDGKTFVVVTAKTIDLRSVQTGKLVWQAPNIKNYSKANFYHSGGRIMLYGDIKQIGLLSTATGETLQTISSSELDKLSSLTLSPDNKSLLSISSTYYLNSWNLTRGTTEKPAYNKAKISTATIISADSKKAITLNYDRGNMDLEETDITQNVPPVNYPAPEGGDRIYVSGISYDNKYTFSSSFFYSGKDSPDRNGMEVYDMATRQKILSFRNTTYAGAFANTKDMLAVKAEKADPTLNFYDIPSGKLLFKFTDANIQERPGEFLFSNTDRYLAMHNDRDLAIIDLTAKKFIPVGKRFGGYASAYAFTPDDKHLVIGGSDGDIDIYNIATRSFVGTSFYRAHNTGFLTGGVLSIAFTKNGKYMFTSGGDKTVKLWDFATQTLLATLYSFPDTNDWAVVTPDGHFDASPGAQENMYYVRGINTIALADLYEKFYTPQLLVRLLNGEKMPAVNVDINALHPKPVVTIIYHEKERNLEVVADKPTFNNTTGIAELTVKATAAQDKVDEIRLFQNGKVVNLATRGLFVTDNAGADSKTYTVNLLPGRNIFRALALNSQRTESKAEEIIVNYSDPAKTSAPAPAYVNAGGFIAAVDKDATIHLIVVGINKYKNPKMSLNYALADATSFKNEAETDAATISPNIKTYFITDDNANKDGILEAFKTVKQNAKPQDVLLFYYAGHGVISDKNKEFYLVPNDVADLSNVDAALAQHGIPAKMLQQFAIDIAAQKQVFILDACQSAGAFSTLLTDDANRQKSMAVVARSTGTHWIAASGSQQFAQEFSQLGHGAFTYVLLRAMKGEAASNKMITINGLKNYLQAQLPDLMKKYNGAPQYPSSYGMGDDFPVEVMK